ncbi:hypothetical protein VTI28DRAFT_10301 [Corynascus sepedonium]
MSPSISPGTSGTSPGKSPGSGEVSLLCYNNNIELSSVWLDNLSRFCFPSRYVDTSRAQLNIKISNWLAARRASSRQSHQRALHCPINYIRGVSVWIRLRIVLKYEALIPRAELPVHKMSSFQG